MSNGRFRSLFLLASVVLIGTVLLIGVAVRLWERGTLPFSSAPQPQEERSGMASAGLQLGKLPKAPSLSFVPLSSGLHHACALRADGTPVCWGWNAFSQASPPPGETFVALSSWGSFSCALRADGTPVCWGSNPALPPGETFVALSTGDGFACALRADGTPACWSGGKIRGDEVCGYLDSRQGWDREVIGKRVECTPSETFVALSSGDDHACALRTDGTPVCWGNNEEGQISPPDGETFALPSSN